MKSEFILFALCLSVVAVVCLSASNINPLNILQLSSSLEPSAVEASPAAPAPAVPKVVIAKKVAAHPAAEIAQIDSTVAAVPEPTPAPVPLTAAPLAAPVKPFPTAGMIALDTKRAGVLDQFGEPAMSTMSTEDGHPIETYVYSRNGGHEVTVVELKDGSVAKLQFSH